MRNYDAFNHLNYNVYPCAFKKTNRHVDKAGHCGPVTVLKSDTRWTIWDFGHLSPQWHLALEGLPESGYRWPAVLPWIAVSSSATNPSLCNLRSTTDANGDFPPFPPDGPFDPSWSQWSSLDTRDSDWFLLRSLDACEKTSRVSTNISTLLQAFHSTRLVPVQTQGSAPKRCLRLRQTEVLPKSQPSNLTLPNAPLSLLELAHTDHLCCYSVLLLFSRPVFGAQSHVPDWNWAMFARIRLTTGRRSGESRTKTFESEATNICDGSESVTNFSVLATTSSQVNSTSFSAETKRKTVQR